MGLNCREAEKATVPVLQDFSCVFLTNLAASRAKTIQDFTRKKREKHQE